MHDDELRTQLAELVRPVASRPVPDIELIRRRARRRGARRAAAAATITAVLAAGVVALVTSLPGPAAVTKPAGPVQPPVDNRPWYLAGPLPAADAPPSVAPYIVTIAFQLSSPPVLVLNAFTGRQVGLVNSPVPGDGFQGVQAAGDDRTFVLASAEPTVVRFYELRLARDGAVSFLRPVFTLPGGGGVPAFAVSPDASKIAYATAHGITVVSVGTGATSSWTASDGSATDLSWAGDQRLAFVWHDLTGNGKQAGVRILDVATPALQAGNLLASRLIIPVPDRTALGDFDSVSNTLVTADGSLLFGTVVTGEPASPRAEVVEFDASTGRARAVVTPPAGESGMGSSCMALWTDPAGARLTAQCGAAHGAGTIDGGHFTASALQVPSYNFAEGRQQFIAW
ncbi:MAG: hypothetical protein ACRDOB_03670 [Streptosporangiaceae bacterium]